MKNKSASFLLIDKQVFITMLLISIVSLFVFAFRLKYEEPCQAVNFLYDAMDFYANSPVYFKADVMNAKEYEWNFGDGTKPQTGSATITHVYQNPGKYTVLLTVNGRCVGAPRNIEIKDDPSPVIDQSLPNFSCYGCDSAQVGKSIKFIDATPGATKWEWMFEENGKVHATTKEADYVYRTPGQKTIHLVVNGRLEKVATYTIYVKEQKQENEVTNPISEKGKQKNKRIINIGPTIDPSLFKVDTTKDKPKEEVKQNAPEITPAEMSAELKNVVAGAKTADDFSKYLCANLNRQVFFNIDKITSSNREKMTFTEMCKRLSELKGRKVKRIDVDITRDGTTGCILSMSVFVKMKLL